MLFVTKNEDIAVIAAIHREALPHLKWSYDKKYLRKMIGFPECLCWTVKVRGKIIGSLHYYIEREFTLNAIAISREYRGRGYGKRIMRWVELMAKWYGYQSVYLWSLDNCIEYYEALGYERVKKSGKWTEMKKILK